MKSMVLKKLTNLNTNKFPLELLNEPMPVRKENEVLLKISACGVCHTELDEIEGRTNIPKLPIILGHQIVGKIVETGNEINKFRIGDRVGVAWIFSTCGQCKFCKSGFENLCDQFVGTGRDVNGGYAEYISVPQAFVHKIPENFSDIEVAPLLCAGAIGYRSVRLTGIRNGQSLGLMGFGASSHLVLKMIKHVQPKSQVYVFTQSDEERTLAISLGADWTGKITDVPPKKINCIIDTTPIWYAVVRSMYLLEKGGRLVINTIQKEEIDKPTLQQIFYSDHLWMEKELKTVANITRKDVTDFLQLASKMKLKPEIQTFKLEDANIALLEMKEQKIRGAKVLVM